MIDLIYTGMKLLVIFFAYFIGQSYDVSII
jgi:hypothetical protein